jgi:hypothetical protein
MIRDEQLLNTLFAFFSSKNCFFHSAFCGKNDDVLSKDDPRQTQFNASIGKMRTNIESLQQQNKEITQHSQTIAPFKNEIQNEQTIHITKITNATINITAKEKSSKPQSKVT